MYRLAGYGLRHPSAFPFEAVAGITAAMPL
jgi:hypothetical protein